MIENNLKIIFTFLSIITNFITIVYIVVLNYFYSVFSNEEMGILIMIIAPLITVYIPIFVKSISNKKDIKTKKIPMSSAVFYIFIFLLLIVSIWGVIYLRSEGYIPNFMNLVYLIGIIEASLGISMGMIIQSLYLK